MFVIIEADAAAIRATFDQEGELSAAIEMRRRFPGITDNTKARTCAGEYRRVDAACSPTKPGCAAACPQGRLGSFRPGAAAGAVVCAVS